MSIWISGSSVQLLFPDLFLSQLSHCSSSCVLVGACCAVFNVFHWSLLVAGFKKGAYFCLVKESYFTEILEIIKF